MSTSTAGMERLGERVFTDIDYAAYGKHRGKLVPFFQKAGYDFDKDTMMYFGQDRHIYFGDKIPMIDVFYDKLDMNHMVDYRGRLEIHPYCVSLTDLLLQKLQIVEINDKDLKDAMLLLVAAPLSAAVRKGSTWNSWQSGCRTTGDFTTPARRTSAK